MNVDPGYSATLVDGEMKSEYLNDTHNFSTASCYTHGLVNIKAEFVCTKPDLQQI